MSVRYVEARASPRILVNSLARIIVVSGNLRVKESFECTILNMSQGGALISSDKPIRATEFYLEEGGAAKRMLLCAVVRRESEYRVGVRFIS